MSRVLIVGAGAAGMMAGIAAAGNGCQVCIIEKNEKCGKKLFITGKGRCNLTNDCDMDALFQNVVTNRKFLYSAFYGFDNYDAIRFFEELGLKTKTERGGRVFPASDKSSDVIRVLEAELKRLNVDIMYHTAVKRIVVRDERFHGLEIDGRDRGRQNKDTKPDILTADAAIIATGGLSYPVTGSDGDGYKFARQAGHVVTDTGPSLVPLQIREAFVKELQGLSLKNIRISLYAGKKMVYEEFGEMLFTHFGVSGPVILSASSYLAPYLKKERSLSLVIDLKPALSDEMLDARILRDFDEVKNRQLVNGLDKLLPKKLIPVMISVCGLDEHKKINSVTREERNVLVRNLKNLTLHIDGMRGYNEAIITRGGVDVRDVNPTTMESLKMPGIYFAGEVLDLDALTGGFNLQIAWSTGYVAGKAV